MWCAHTAPDKDLSSGLLSLEAPGEVLARDDLTPAFPHEFLPNANVTPGRTYWKQAEARGTHLPKPTSGTCCASPMQGVQHPIFEGLAKVTKRIQEA